MDCCITLSNEQGITLSNADLSSVVWGGGGGGGGGSQKTNFTGRAQVSGNHVLNKSVHTRLRIERVLILAQFNLNPSMDLIHYKVCLVNRILRAHIKEYTKFQYYQPFMRGIHRWQE